MARERTWTGQIRKEISERGREGVMENDNLKVEWDEQRVEAEKDKT